MRLEKQHAIDREEFELVQRDRNAFDQVAWASSVAHRLHMPTASADILDPGPDPLAAAGERTRSLFLADSGEAVRTRPAKAPQRALGFVTGVSVGGRDILAPGTLLVRVDREAVEDVDPRTLHLFRWDVEREAYEVVQACGLNVDHGYVWGRITRPGTYVVFGLPLPRTFADLRLVNGFSLGAAQVIISRVFVPDGDWASLGPRHLSCCILDLAIERPDGVRLYAAASDGGLWRLDDVTAYPSQTWVPITDAQPSLAVSRGASSHTRLISTGSTSRPRAVCGPPGTAARRGRRCELAT